MEVTAEVRLSRINDIRQIMCTQTHNVGDNGHSAMNFGSNHLSHRAGKPPQLTQRVGVRQFMIESALLATLPLRIAVTLCWALAKRCLSLVKCVGFIQRRTPVNTDAVLAMTNKAERALADDDFWVAVAVSDGHVCVKGSGGVTAQVAASAMRDAADLLDVHAIKDRTFRKSLN